MRTPDHSHARSSSRLDARNAVLEHKAFFGVDDGFALGSQFFVDALERQEVDVRRGLASSFWYSGVIAEDATGGRERAEEVGQVRRLQAIIGGVRRSGEREVGV